MTTINKLSSLDTVTGSDQLPAYSSGQGDARKLSVTLLKQFIVDNFIQSQEVAVGVSSGDLFVFYDASAQKTYKVDVNVIRDFVVNNLFSVLSAQNTVDNADKIAFYDDSAAGIKSLTINLLSEHINKNYFTTQVESRSATGFSVSINNSSVNTHLILKLDAGYANGTIVLPAVANLVDKQELLVNCTQAVSSLSITLNGATAAIGAPTALLANGFFRLKYNLSDTSWYRVG